MDSNNQQNETKKHIRKGVADAKNSFLNRNESR